MTMPYIQANTGGQLHDATTPSISPLNRGFLYGDAIYEVWRTYRGVIFAWDEHWARLEKSAAALHFVLPFTREEILTEIKRTVKAYRAVESRTTEVYIRLQVTRGEGAIGLDTLLAESPRFVVLVQENKLFSREKFEAGLTLSIANTLHRNPASTLNPAWKTGNYLNNILCLREARARGADEVIITNLAGEITEAAVSNIAFVRAGEVITPPLEAGILAGITRRILIDHVGPATGIRVGEERILPRDIERMDECFLLSSTKDITPVKSVDTVTFPNAAREVTLRLKRAFEDYAITYAERRREELSV